MYQPGRAVDLRRRVVAVAALTALTAACSTPDGPHVARLPTGEEIVKQKVGKPYKIGGVWYYPAVDPGYDETGIASWYGPKFHGQPTANGEIFNMNALSAAHPTLPLPSQVLVTNLDNGRSLKLRINDRGPFAKGRIIDVSRRAAQLLGFERRGPAKVRVQILDADGLPRTAEPSPPDTPGPDIVAAAAPPRPEKLPATVIPEGPLYVQVGAFSDVDKASSLARLISDFDDVSVDPASVEGAVFYRVRVGPFDDRGRAEDVLEQVRARGFAEARIFTDRIS